MGGHRKDDEQRQTGERHETRHLPRRDASFEGADGRDREHEQGVRQSVFRLAGINLPGERGKVEVNVTEPFPGYSPTSASMIGQSGTLP